jgi:hypothetical protein
MFAHDLCHRQIEYFGLRLADPAARRGMLSILIEKTERSDTINLQSSIPACPGWVLFDIKISRKDFLTEVMSPVIGLCLD